MVGRRPPDQTGRPPGHRAAVPRAFRGSGVRWRLRLRDFRRRGQPGALEHVRLARRRRRLEGALEHDVDVLGALLGDQLQDPADRLAVEASPYDEGAALELQLDDGVAGGLGLGGTRSVGRAAGGTRVLIFRPLTGIVTLGMVWLRGSKDGEGLGSVHPRRSRSGRQGFTPAAPEAEAAGIPARPARAGVVPARPSVARSAGLLPAVRPPSR